MKKYKNYLAALSVISTLTLGLVGCMGFKGEEVASENMVKEQVVEIADEKQEKKIEITDGNIIEVSEQIRKFMGLDEDLGKYLQNEPTMVTFLKDGNSENSDVNIIYIYEGNEDGDSTALYLYIENDQIVNAKLDEYNGFVDLNWKEDETVVFTNSGQLEKQPKEENISLDFTNRELAQEKVNDKFVGKELREFNEFIDYYVPVTKIVRKDRELVMYVYYAINKEGYTMSTTMNVITKDNVIKEIYLDDSYKPSINPVDKLKL
ncbi:MAG: hypothetical protein N4A57_15805 [Anaeromicrobium sp.]|jgi:hypothetical protein|uniref:hypothetical protein n=1 Tax=Anaeromicrobium sp. TaxID=1929132 RepID=UPI0025FDC81D|nr:hypothetical protein [Anaeromicrobium sp.]MCT4595713.1 hypothetical protein [Anaeromicrobium sp.]